MSIAETSLSDLQDQCLANKESQLNQTVPLQPRAFLRVESVVNAGSLKSLEKRAVYGQKQCLAATALREGLRAIARDYGEDINPAVKAVFTVEADASPGDSVSAGAELTSDDTGAYYICTTGGSESGGVVEFVITALIAGEDANLEAAQTLTFTSSTGRTATVDDSAEITSVDTYGEDEEDLEDFRRRVLALQRKTSGGGNNSDYREWAEAVSGVARAFPYSGKPVTFQVTRSIISFAASDNSINIEFIGWDTAGLGEPYAGDMIRVTGSLYNDGIYTVQSWNGTTKIVVVENLVNESVGEEILVENCSLPGDRTVYIEADDDDGIPSESLLENVRDGINYNSDDEEQPGLGDPDSTLYVEPITKVEFDVEIFGLEVDSTQETACKANIETDLEAHFEALIPYIEGLDFEFEKNDIATITAAARIVQNVLQAYGASADTLALTVDGDFLTSYQLGQGELGKLGTITYTDVT